MALSSGYLTYCWLKLKRITWLDVWVMKFDKIVNFLISMIPLLFFSWMCCRCSPCVDGSIFMLGNSTFQPFVYWAIGAIHQTKVQYTICLYSEINSLVICIVCPVFTLISEFLPICFVTKGSCWKWCSITQSDIFFFW